MEQTRTYTHENGGTIEISPRASGKTTRLIQAVMEYIMIDSSHMALVFVPITHDKRNMRYRINERIQDLGLPYRLRQQVIVHALSSFTPMGGMSLQHQAMVNQNKLFFDDFENRRDIGLENLPFVPTAYYTATPMVNFRESNTYRWMRELSHGPDLTGRESSFISHFINLSNLNPEFNQSPRPQGREPAVDVPTIDSPIVSVRVEPRARALNGRWTIEAAEDPQGMHAVDMEQEMTNILEQEDAPEQPQSEVDDYLDRLGI